MLTVRQNDLLKFIHERMKESGIAPSYDEMATGVGVASRSGVHRLLVGLEERGFIRRLPNRSRAIEIVRLPEVMAPRFGRGHAPSVIDGGLGRVGDAPQMVAVPVMGRIAAGTPIAAIQNRSHVIHVAPEMLSSGDHFALECRGDSMIEAGIFEGDLGIIRKTETGENGDIVVAIIDDMEATLKRLRRRGTSICLEAANPAYETRIFGPDRIRFLGRLVGLMRRY